MRNLARVIDSLRKQAEDQREQAYRILGAKPGPGLDLLIHPQEPMDGQWFAEGLTEAGRNFIAKFWLEQPLSTHKLRQLKSEAMDWGLKYQIKYPTLSIGEDE